MSSHALRWQQTSLFRLVHDMLQYFETPYAETSVSLERKERAECASFEQT